MSRIGRMPVIIPAGVTVDIEENNKVVIYTFGLDPEGHLESKLSEHVANNIKEDPEAEKRKGKLPLQFEHKIVDFCSHGDTLTFILSTVTGRWWMEVPLIKKNTTQLVACTADDFHTAEEGQVPLRWLYHYNRLNSL